MSQPKPRRHYPRSTARSQRRVDNRFPETNSYRPYLLLPFPTPDSRFATPDSSLLRVECGSRFAKKLCIAPHPSSEASPRRRPGSKPIAIAGCVCIPFGASLEGIPATVVEEDASGEKPDSGRLEALSSDIS